MTYKAAPVADEDGDMAPPRFSRSPTPTYKVDDLATALGGETGRIDYLVKDVGEIKGDVQTLRSQVGRVADGQDRLMDSMAVLSRHAVLMETQSAEINAVRTAYSGLEGRVRVIEQAQPALEKSAAFQEKAVWLVIAAVMAAVLSVVLLK